MAITFTSTMAGASTDYVRYLFGSPQKTDRYLDSTLLDFSLASGDNPAFVKLQRGAYITINSTKYGKWFTGYITTDPELEYLGVNAAHQPVWGYRYQATSDEYLLSLKAIGVMPTFLNATMGQILKTLVNKLAPGIFDVSNIQDGPLVAQYTVDTTKTFYNVQKELCDASSYLFYANDHKLYFMPQDSVSKTITLDGNDRHFSPNRLQIKASQNPVINDVTVLGDLEPQTYMSEYFVGTGLDADFPLIAGPYGTDSTVLLDETFSSPSLDSSKWQLTDLSGYFSISNGYMNVVGGDGTWYNNWFSSLYPIPLSGKLRLTHGEWDFVPSGGNCGRGVIGGLWSGGLPSNSLAHCIYGVLMNANVLTPLVNGVSDSTQSITVDLAKRYVIRTIVEFGYAHRTRQTYSYLDDTGTRQEVSSSAPADTATWSTVITEIDPSNGRMTNQWRWKNTAAVSASYATYMPIVTLDLHATVTSITISVPLFASLDLAAAVPLVNADFSEWADTTTPLGWINNNGGTKYVDPGNPATSPPDIIFAPDGGGNASIDQKIDKLVQAKTKYNVIVSLKGSSPTGTITVKPVGTGISDPGITVSASSLNAGTYQVFTGTFIVSPGYTTVPADLIIRISMSGIASGTTIVVSNVALMSDWSSQIVGPNEIDTMDGLAPVATITAPNVGAQTASTYTGTAQYNPGQAHLTFFKDSVTLSSDIPPANMIIRLAYRAAGAAAGRVTDGTSISAEQTAWGDDGVRAVVRTDLSPRPQTSMDAEAAAAAIVNESSYTHYEGSYTQFSTYFTTEPISGAILKFTHLTSMAADLQAEQINEVVTTLQSIPHELFSHQITFGTPDYMRKVYAKIGQPIGTYQRTNEGDYQIPIIDATAIGTNFCDDVPRPLIVGWDDNWVYIDAGQNLPPGGHFEVRYTDEGWGTNDGKNLWYRWTTRQFPVPRSLRGRVVFIKLNVGSTYSRFASGVHVAFPSDLNSQDGSGASVPPASATTITDAHLTSGPTVVTTKQGVKTWGAAFAWTNPSTDPAFEKAELFVQKLKVSDSTPVADDPESIVHKVGEVKGAGVEAAVAFDGWPFPKDETTVKYRFTIKTVNKAGVETSCTTAFSSNPWLDVQVLDIGPTIPASALDPATIGLGLIGDDFGLKFGYPQASNILQNPEFEDGLKKWTASDPTSITVQSSGAYTGAKCVKMVGDGKFLKQTGIACKPDDTFTFTCYMKTSSLPVNGVISIFLQFWNADRSTMLLQTSSAGYSATGSGANTTWTKLAVDGLAPANSSQFDVVIELATNSSGYFLVDTAVCEKAFNVGTGVQWVLGQVSVHDVPGSALADGALDDLAKFGSSLRPMKIVTSLPTLPDSANYPAGAAIVLNDGAHYKVYRSTGSAWTSAVDGGDILAATVTAQAFQAGSVTAQAMVVGNFDNLCVDPGFEKSSPVLTSGNLGTNWTPETSAPNGWSIDNTAGHSRSGNNCLVFANASGNGAFPFARNSNIIDCKPDDQFYVEAWMFSTVGATGSGLLRVIWKLKNGTESASTYTMSPTVGTWQEASLTVTAPSNAIAAQLTLGVSCPSSGGAGSWFFDDVYVHKIVVTSYIADAAIISAKIASLQVNDGHITNLAASKLTAGTLAVGVVYAGQVNVAQVNAGQFTSQTMQVSQNGYVAQIDSFFNADLGGWVGMSMSHVGYNDHLDITSNGWAIYAPSGTLCTHAQAGGFTSGTVNGITSSFDFGSLRMLRNGYQRVYLSGYQGAVECEYIKFYDHTNTGVPSVIGHLWCSGGHLYFGTSDPSPGNTWSSAGTLIV
jgi:hypothetical protein